MAKGVDFLSADIMSLLSRRVIKAERLLSNIYFKGNIYLQDDHATQR